MVERKKHLANVAFGGGWSEELVEREMLSRIMGVLEKAAEDCFDGKSGRLSSLHRLVT